MIDGLWEKANSLSELGYKVHNAAMIIELVASDTCDNAQSGAAWAAADMLKELSDKIETLSCELMLINQMHEEKETKPKGKKK